MRDCENCKHHILNDYKNMTYGCESWECKFEPKESIFDKIRAEIKAASLGKWYVGRIDGKAEEVLLMADVLQILDKYKADRSEE